MYLALYRKYRPRTFDDVISQEHITTTLKNQITNGTTAHAYLFTGSRGTGKTTCAKILAMAMNCLSPRNGNPCLECESCREIADGSVTDIVEMDAASNNGVDDVRALRDEVAYTPVSCRYRVYIIDEVHMLSINAFNALLKTLEEPPPHVKFILATTELHKVPATIVSRCQRMEFRRIDINDSAARLLEVAKKEGADLDGEAAELISRLSDGGMRDALSVLDRCLSADGKITADVVREYAGVADNRHLFRFTEMIADGDAAGCIGLLAELHGRSKDIARIIDELSMTFRDLMLCRTIPGAAQLLSAMPCDHAEIKRLAEKFTLENILRCLELLRQCADSMGKTRQRRTAAEMCFVRMCLGLSAQGGDNAPRAAVNAASAAQAPQTPAAVRFVEVPQEKFEPTPLKDLSPQSAANISKIRELQADMQKVLSEGAVQKPASVPVSAAAAETGVAAPLPVMNSAPAAPDNFEMLPPEEPPEDYIPQREFDTAPSMGTTPAGIPQKPVQKPADVKPAEAAKPAEKVRSAAETAEKPQHSQLRDISAEEWSGAVEKISDVMLFGSAVRREGDSLVVTVRTAFVAESLNSNPEEHREKSDEICEALGISAGISFEGPAGAGAPAAVESGSEEVRKLLKKAEQLDIEVIIK